MIQDGQLNLLTGGCVVGMNGAWWRVGRYDGSIVLDLVENVVGWIMEAMLSSD